MSRNIKLKHEIAVFAGQKSLDIGSFISLNLMKASTLEVEKFGNCLSKTGKEEQIQIMLFFLKNALGLQASFGF